MPNNWTLTGFFGVIGLHTIVLTLFLPLPIFFHVAIYYIFFATLFSKKYVIPLYTQKSGVGMKGYSPLTF